MGTKARRNICKICNKKSKGQYYKIGEINKSIWMCDKCIQNQKDNKIKAIIK